MLTFTTDHLKGHSVLWDRADLGTNSIQRNMNKRGEKSIGAGRKKSPSFTIYNQINESLTLASKNSLYVLGDRWKRFRIFGKSSFLDLEPSTMSQTFSPLLMHVRIQKYSSMFGFPWTNPSVNSQWYIKKCECSDMA